jgi:hypothetical protein
MNDIILTYAIVSWQDHASDLRQVIDELDLKTPDTQLIGIGHSVGATATYVNVIEINQPISLRNC